MIHLIWRDDRGIQSLAASEDDHFRQGGLEGHSDLVVARHGGVAMMRSRR